MFKENFVNLLQLRGLSAYRIAKDTRIPKSVLYAWASGENEPASEYLPDLADYLDCSVDYLLGRTDKPEVNR